MTLHNTTPGRTYHLWSTESLSDPDWTLEDTQQGTAGQDFTVFPPVNMQGLSGMRDTLFFRATEVGDYTIGSSFKGLDTLDTGGTVADSMGAVGPDHFVELLNGMIAVYDKTGQAVGSPMPAEDFFEVENEGVTYPTLNLVDPRIVYDHQEERWVACGLDFGSRNVLLAISESSNPVSLETDWERYLVPVSRGTPDRADFPTLGLDANGIYISVWYSVSSDNAVVAVDKEEIYVNSNYQAWLFEIAWDTPPIRIIQPPVNFDPSPLNDYVWLVCKEAPEYDGQTYSGGPVAYRRLQWVSGAPQWKDDTWVPVAESTPGYRDYFDLDEGDPSKGAPQLGGGENGKRIRVDGSTSGGVGSRLSMAVIRDGVLWTCHHVGLDGTDGDYDGDETGDTVDRSGIQWWRFQIDSSGDLVTQPGQSHGRFYDSCGDDPVWYYYPSLMVNSVGDMVAGFSGSSSNIFISAFYAWRFADGTVAERPGVLMRGEDYFGLKRWGDYSYTSLDPTDSLTFWTVQKYARQQAVPFPGWQLPEWGTCMAELKK